MSTSAKVSFLRHGFFYEPALFAPAKVEAIRVEIKLVFWRRMRDLGMAVSGQARHVSDAQLFEFFRVAPDDYVACMKAIQNLRASFACVAEPKLVERLKMLGLEQSSLSTKPIIMLNSPHTARQESHWKMPPHQDWRSVQGSLNGVIVWIALEDVGSNLGPLEVIPGSHAWGLLDSEPDEWYRRITDPRLTDDAWQPVPMFSGDALFFSSFLVHRSGVNISNQARYSIQLRFNDLAEPSFIARGYPSTYDSDRPSKDFVSDGYTPTAEEIMASFHARRSAEDDA